MARIFEESFKKMAVELSYLKGSVAEAAKELELDPSRLSKRHMDPRLERDILKVGCHLF